MVKGVKVQKFRLSKVKLSNPQTCLPAGRSSNHQIIVYIMGNNFD
jgi:hypothetical protein